jgi:hypothetical protein
MTMGHRTAMLCRLPQAVCQALQSVSRELLTKKLRYAEDLASCHAYALVAAPGASLATGSGCSGWLARLGSLESLVIGSNSVLNDLEHL